MRSDASTQALPQQTVRVDPCVRCCYYESDARDRRSGGRFLARCTLRTCVETEGMLYAHQWHTVGPFQLAIRRLFHRPCLRRHVLELALPRRIPQRHRRIHYRRQRGHLSVVTTATFSSCTDAYISHPSFLAFSPMFSPKGFQFSLVYLQ